jgi:hypothetical protein
MRRIRHSSKPAVGEAVAGEAVVATMAAAVAADTITEEVDVAVMTMDEVAVAVSTTPVVAMAETTKIGTQPRPPSSRQASLQLVFLLVSPFPAASLRLVLLPRFPCLAVQASRRHHLVGCLLPLPAGIPPLPNSSSSSTTDNSAHHGSNKDSSSRVVLRLSTITTPGTRIGHRTTRMVVIAGMTIAMGLTTMAATIVVGVMEVTTAAAMAATIVVATLAAIMRTADVSGDFLLA